MYIAKLAAVMITSDQPLAVMYGIDKVNGMRVQLVQAPATAWDRIRRHEHHDPDNQRDDKLGTVA